MASFDVSVADDVPANRPFTTRPLSDALGVEIVGITMEEAVGPDVFPQIYQVFLQHQLILFDDVDLPPETQVAFARKFGEVQIHVMDQYHAYGGRYPEIYFLTNLDSDGNPTGAHPDKGTMHWHTDGSWKPRTGQATMMYSEIVPDNGGETHFANMYNAWDTLEQDWKDRIAGLKAVHNLDFSRTRRHGEDPLTDAQRNKIPPVAHPVVRTHPETGRNAIFLGDHAESIEGMDYEAGRELIETLNAMATPEDRIYRHRWRPRQCMVWDNRCLLHRATAYDTANTKRVMRRCTIVGEAPY
ncbi:TauD/TfdA dioxygenase family protein [Hwanghaeella sp.]|uniref:TauD/TfdA dioxygenase family protein n=1 Tax=Hwanghaeella sp. TaxID=2605943 RepID=UPI003CCC0113